MKIWIKRATQCLRTPHLRVYPLQGWVSLICKERFVPHHFDILSNRTCAIPNIGGSKKQKSKTFIGFISNWTKSLKFCKKIQTKPDHIGYIYFDFHILHVHAFIIQKMETLFKHNFVPKLEPTRQMPKDTPLVKENKQNTEKIC